MATFYEPESEFDFEQEDDIHDEEDSYGEDMFDSDVEEEPWPRLGNYIVARPNIQWMIRNCTTHMAPISPIEEKLKIRYEEQKKEIEAVEEEKRKEKAELDRISAELTKASSKPKGFGSKWSAVATDAAYTKRLEREAQESNKKYGEIVKKLTTLEAKNAPYDRYVSSYETLVEKRKEMEIWYEKNKSKMFGSA
jgi:predicted  nucleic acid-binding Zn-ribbon protein